MSIVGKDYQISIASSPDNISELESFIDQIREENEIKDEIFGNVLIALTEAVNNCIEHGNLCDSSKDVVVSCAIRDNILTCSAEDQGAGFDYKHLPDPTDPDNIEKATGRGVFLMRQLSDDLVYSNNGATVEMKFSL